MPDKGIFNWLNKGTDSSANTGVNRSSTKGKFNLMDKKNLTLLILLLFLIAATTGILRQGRLNGVFADGSNPEGLQQTQEGPGFEAASGQDVNIEAILDVSGSMWGQVKGVNKIVSSREVLGIFLKDLPVNARVGLRTFGGKGESRLVVPMGGDKDEIKNIVDKLRPSGKSPIGYALEQAGKDLQNMGGKRYIVLISDGIDTGQVDPVAKARELKERGIITHVVYVRNANGQGTDELMKVADAGGGHFFTIDEKDLIAPTLALPK